jgi:hypothetical protein
LRHIRHKHVSTLKATWLLHPFSHLDEGSRAWVDS